MTRYRTSSAVLVTRGDGAELEVLLVERAPELSFFGGYWALPGGTLSPLDGGEEQHGFLQRCALRELYEETGVLPAPLDEVLANRADLRHALIEETPGQAEWARVLETHDRAIDALDEMCCLTTPPFAPLRYRTTFYHLPVPEETEPHIWPGELTDGAFVRPEEILSAWRGGELRLVPPVLFVLETLADGGLEHLLQHLRDRAGEVAGGRLYLPRCSPGVYCAPLRTPTLPPATTTNTYLVGHERFFIIDPATPHEDEQRRLFEVLDDWRAEGARFEGVLVTHHHADHVGAVAATSERYDLPVYAHPRTLERLPDGCGPGRPLEDGDELDLGAAPDGSPGWKLRALHTPGHDQGHLAFLETRYRAAVVGDLVSTVSTIVIDPPEGHLATYLASLRRVLDEDLTTLYPAHGPASPFGADVLRGYLAHRKEREELLVAALGSRPREVPALVEEVYADTDERMHGLAARSLLAGLHKLEEEGLAAQLDGGWIASS